MSLLAPLFLHILDEFIFKKSINKYYIENSSEALKRIHKYIKENDYLLKDEKINFTADFYEKKVINNIDIINRIYIYDARNVNDDNLKLISKNLNILIDEIQQKRKSKKEKYYCNYIILLTDNYDINFQNFLDENTFISPFKIKNYTISDERGDWNIPVALCYKDNNLYFGITKSYPIIFEKRKEFFLDEIIKIDR